MRKKKRELRIGRQVGERYRRWHSVCSEQESGPLVIVAAGMGENGGISTFVCLYICSIARLRNMREKKRGASDRPVGAKELQIATQQWGVKRVARHGRLRYLDRAKVGRLQVWAKKERVRFIRRPETRCRRRENSLFVSMYDWAPIMLRKPAALNLAKSKVIVGGLFPM